MEVKTVKNGMENWKYYRGKFLQGNERSCRTIILYEPE